LTGWIIGVTFLLVIIGWAGIIITEASGARDRKEVLMIVLALSTFVCLLFIVYYVSH
jgi:hypothetical protein